MKRFEFTTHPYAEEFFEEVVKVMLRQYSIPEDTAVRMLNEGVRGFRVGKRHSICHDFPECVAKRFAIGK